MLCILRILPKFRSHTIIAAAFPQEFHSFVNVNRASTSAIPVIKPKGRTTCALIPGDGVGPELCNVILEVFKAAGVPVDFEEFFLSELNPQRSASLESVVRSISENGICLKGILRSSDYSSEGVLMTLNMKLRDSLDLFANVIHVQSFPGLNVRHKNIDMVVIREQTEGEYSALEHESIDGVIECLKIMTRDKCQRIAKFAFDYATKNNRKRVTAVHKANIMKLGDGLFLKCCEEVAALYPKIEYTTMIIDNCTMQMVSNPHQFDVLVLPNLYGNIIGNVAVGLVGGAGVVAGASYSHRCAVFEPGARHSFREAVGKNLANPTAMLLCSTKMLYHVNLRTYGDTINNALYRVIKAGKVKIKGMGG